MKIDFNVNVHLQSIYKISAETDFDGFVGVCDEGDEQAEHHVDEERCEGVQIDSAEKPHHVALVSHIKEGAKHVVSVNEREEALCHFVKCSELKNGNSKIVFG